MLFAFGLVPISVFLHYPAIKAPLANFMHIAGTVLIVPSALLALYVHHLFPSKHETPEDFDRLLSDGPYRYVRHPFYSAFIFLGFGIALYFASVPGILFNVLLILRWNRLAALEEEELLQYWGTEYRQFMQSRPRFVPRVRLGGFCKWCH